MAVPLGFKFSARFFAMTSHSVLDAHPLPDVSAPPAELLPIVTQAAVQTVLFHGQGSHAGWVSAFTGPVRAGGSGPLH